MSNLTNRGQVLHTKFSRGLSIQSSESLIMYECVNVKRYKGRYDDLMDKAIRWWTEIDPDEEP